MSCPACISAVLQFAAIAVIYVAVMIFILSLARAAKDDDE